MRTMACIAAAGLAWLMAWTAQAAAPENGSSSYIVDVWETDDGLPQNSVLSMVQGQDGYLWLATLDGFARFDGIHFTVFSDNNTPGLNSRRILKLFADSHRNLWLGTEAAGIAYIHDGRVINPPEISQGGIERHLTSACEDAEGAVWLYAANGDLWRYNDGHFSPLLLPDDEPSSYRAIIWEKPKGPIWIGTDHFLSAIGPVSAEPLIQLPVTDVIRSRKLDFLLASRTGGFWRLADGQVQKWKDGKLERDLGPYPWSRLAVAACEDPDGNLVVGTQGDGLFWYDEDGHTRHLTNSLSYNYIPSLTLDREGTLWVGTDAGGLDRVKRQVFTLLEISRGATVRSTCDDGEGGLWFAHAGGLVHVTDGTVQRYGARQGLRTDYLRSVLVDRSGHVLAGTYDRGLFELQDNRFREVSGSDKLHPEVSVLYEDPKGNLWVGTQGGVGVRRGAEWTLFTTAQGLSSDEVRAITADAGGDVWIGTRSGLNRLHDGKFTVFRKADGLPSDEISSLYLDRDGVLWIGTVGGGLARLKDGEWTRYSTQDGLNSDTIVYLLEDSQGYLWLGSNAGLMRVKKQALNDFAAGTSHLLPCRVYGKRDGLPSSECTAGSQPAACRAAGGRLWFPTVKGLVSVDPAQLRPNTNPPPVMIESVWIDDALVNTNRLRVGWPDAVRLSAGKQRLDIAYTSLNLAAPRRARFRYRMENYENRWIEAGDTRVARYSRLPPGHYRFEVTACNEDGLWNPDPQTLAVTVVPPVWRTWWFLTAAALLLLAAIVSLVHYASTQKLQRQLQLLKQQEAVEKERSRIARDIHDQLGASLTQISLLGELVESDKDMPEEVESHARQISQTARETTRVLDEIVWTVNPSNDTLDGLVTYICKNAQDYLSVAGLRYRLDIPADLPPIPIAPEVRHNVFLAAKEAVTNVVRHAQATSAWLRLRLEPKAFTLEIQDDGRGFHGLDERGRTRHGLRNMARRLEEIGGSFSIEAAPEGGTIVRLTAPLSNGKFDASAKPG